MSRCSNLVGSATGKENEADRGASTILHSACRSRIRCGRPCDPHVAGTHRIRSTGALADRLHLLFGYMHHWRLFVLTGLAGGLLAAENGSPAGDPFTAYHRAIESRLSAMLARDQAQTRESARSASDLETRTEPDESGKLELMAFVNRFWGGREREFATALDRLQRLRSRLEPILASVGVPRELVALALVESGAQPLATSPRRARGLWQLIPETAQQYGLAVNASSDQRIDLEPATRAAARYLRDLYARFRDWPLALAAYNAGPKAVQDALNKGHMSTFSQLSSARLLPAETRSYVPAVLAAMRLVRATLVTAPGWETERREARVYATAGVPN